MYKTGICGNRAFKDTMAAVIRNKMKTGAEHKPLDLGSHAAHSIHFMCGTTMYLGYTEDIDGFKTPVPFEEQVAPGRREHRNSRSCPVPFQPLEGDLADKIDAFCEAYVAAYEEIGQFYIDEHDPESVLNMLQSQ